MNSEVILQDAMSSLEKKYPYVLVDKIIEIDHEKHMIKALKCASNTDPYYSGHFPDNPTMPGVLLLMAFSQAASVLYGGEEIMLKSIEKVRFQFPVYPGHRLIIMVQEIERTKEHRILQCLGEVDAKVCIKAKLLFSAGSA